MKTEKPVKTWQTPTLQAVEMKATAGGIIPSSNESQIFNDFVPS